MQHQTHDLWKKYLIDKLDFFKIKTSALWKAVLREREVTDWKEIFAKDTSDKGLLSKIYKTTCKTP